MSFRTKLDYSNNRQIKQHVETLTVLSGGTSFGVTFSELTTGPNLLTTGVIQSYSTILSTFTGNSGTTTFSWYNPSMGLGYSSLSAITPSNSGLTQNTGQVFTANTTTIIDGNAVVLSYSGVSFGITPIEMIDLGGGNYSGNVNTNLLQILSANTLDFTGRTIWVDVSGITRTEKLIITNNPTIGYVLTCTDAEGYGEWQPSSGSSGSSVSYWSASTGTNAIVPKNSNSLASGINSISSGYLTKSIGDYSYSEGNLTTASGTSSHAEGYKTTAKGLYSHAEGYGSTNNGVIASGTSSHAEGDTTTALGNTSHAEGKFSTALGNISHSEGNSTIASGVVSHAEGSNTIASGDYSHTEGSYTTASGLASHAGGINSSAIGVHSFIHSSGSTVIGDCSVVLGGSGLTGTSNNTVYVPYLNINNVGSSAFVNDIRIDANGNLTTNTSDIRLKENINTITSALEKIKQLRGVTYNWIDKNAGGDGLKLGFIAQEVGKVVPELTFTNKNDGYIGVHIDGVIPLLVEAIKELSSGNTISNNTFLETQTIVAEDNNIDLNFNGNFESSINGGIRILNGLGENKHIELITNKNGEWTTNNNFKPNSLSLPYYTPVSSNDDNMLGNICIDENFLYLKVNNSKIKRITLEDF